DNIAILSLPYNSHDLYSSGSQISNTLALVAIFGQLFTLIGLVVAIFVIPNCSPALQWLATRGVNVNTKLFTAYSVSIYVHIGAWLIITLLRVYLKRRY